MGLSREERNRLAVPDLKKVNATVNLLTKLDEKTSNWRQWLTSLKGTAQNEGWHPGIFDLAAKLWDENDYESTGEMWRDESEA